MPKRFLVPFFLLFCIGGAVSSCESPEIISSTYTTEDATVLTHIAYISEFTVKCGSGSVSNLYALMGGAVQPIGVIGPSKYQISWTEEVKSARTGDITIKIYDDDGFALLRKAQRAGEDLDGPKAAAFPDSGTDPTISASTGCSMANCLPQCDRTV
ncbi:TRAP-delta domain containing protein [Asbolus verrucosus]|uniref:Translocon-associated protein subunit delta n=1 Tax=Asbolus verrucosus TaxID=1661398 RepID=A0A482W6T2_ASBVE|nr:TRAP-delta domain containing protein [Asbolus verrucosus]